MNQLTLEQTMAARERARSTDPVTSHDAARSVGSMAAEHARIILDVMLRGGDWTADEVAAQSELSRHQIGRRLGEMVRDELIRVTGQMRRTPTGRMAQCYEVAVRGRT